MKFVEITSGKRCGECGIILRSFFGRAPGSQYFEIEMPDNKSYIILKEYVIIINEEEYKHYVNLYNSCNIML